MQFGKNITITIAEDEVIDAAYLKTVLSGDIVKDSPYFELWNKEELKKMIKYMDENDYTIVPGTYTFNQSWNFDAGMFVLNNGEKQMIFNFQKQHR